MKLRGRGVVLCVVAAWTMAAMVARADRAAKFDGRPGFTEGSDRGYFVWCDGEKWHVRWTTAGETRRFTGNVVAEGGKLKGLKRIDVEKESELIRRGVAPHVVVGPRGRAHVRGGRAPVVVTKEEDKIEKDGDQKIYWISKTVGDIDGFDFEVGEGVEALRFVLEINGKMMPRFVRVGKDESGVSGIPFRVELR